MYANLKVTRNGREFYAYEVVIEKDRVVVRLDAQDGEGSYPEPAGDVTMRPGDGIITIEADF